jgi:hypothetical protein
MSNPNATNQPDTYLGTNWVNTVGCTPSQPNDYCGVHTNSGVLNFWFFLLSDGGTGTNDLSNNYTVNGVTINTAARIAYLTKLALGNSLATFPLARSVSIQVTRQEYGIGSCEEVAVTNAWFAVGVGPAFTAPTPYTAVISGPETVCTVPGGNIFTVSVPPGATATWSGGSWLNITYLTPDGSQISAQPGPSSGYVYLGVTITANNGCFSGTIATGSKLVKVGSPNYYTQTPYWTQNGNTTYMEDCNKIVEITGGKFYTASGYVNDQVAGTYSWSKVGNSPGNHFTWGSSGNTFNVMVKTIYQGEYIILRCTVTNSCGTGYRDYKFTTATVGCPVIIDRTAAATPAQGIRLYPNPASSTTQIELAGNNPIQQLEIRNKLGVVVQSIKGGVGKNVRTINLSNLAPDIYIVSVFDGVNWYSEKLSVVK